MPLRSFEDDPDFRSLPTTAQDRIRADAAATPAPVGPRRPTPAPPLALTLRQNLTPIPKPLPTPPQMPAAMRQQLAGQRARQIPRNLQPPPSTLDDIKTGLQDAWEASPTRALATGQYPGQPGIPTAAPPPLTHAIPPEVLTPPEPPVYMSPAPTFQATLTPARASYAQQLADAVKNSMAAHALTADVPALEADVNQATLNAGALGHGLLANEAAGAAMFADPGNIAMGGGVGGGRLAQAGLGAITNAIPNALSGSGENLPLNLVAGAAMGALTGGHVAPERTIPKGLTLREPGPQRLAARDLARGLEMWEPPLVREGARPPHPHPVEAEIDPTPAPAPAGGPALVPDAPRRGGAPHEMTRSEFEATGEDLLHGTSRQFDAFDPEAGDRYGKTGRNNAKGRFYFTDQPQVADSFSRIGGKAVDLHHFADANDLDPHEALPQLVDALKRQTEKGARLFTVDPETGHQIEVQADHPLVRENLLEEGATTIYAPGRGPKVIKTNVYGPTLDLTDRASIPPDLVEALKREGVYNPHEEFPNFQHEHSRVLYDYAREHGYGKIKVRDTYESGFSSTIGLNEFIGHGRDPHRAFVERALAEGKHVPPEVLADYPDLARPAPPAEVKPGLLRGLVAREEGHALNPFDWLAEKLKREPSASAAEAIPGAGTRPTFRRQVDPAAIHLDPQTYQFKASDAQGRTDRLAGVQAWDAEGAGIANPVILHERTDGRLYVADGHQRVNLAQRLRAEGKPVPNLNAIVLREKDGWSVADVRNRASRLNIQQGTGTALDVARLIRDGGLTDKDMAIMPRQGDQAAALRLGRQLAELGDDAFLFVANEHVVPGDPKRNAELGAAAAQVAKEPAQQLAILQEMRKDPPASQREALLLAREIAADGFQKVEQNTLFGVQDFARSTHRTVARLLRGLENAIARDKKLGGMLTEKAGAIEAIGGNRLDAEANATLRTDAERLQFALDTLATTKGPFRDALKAIAQEVDRDHAPVPIEEAVRRARAALADALQHEIGAGGPGGSEPVHRQPGEVPEPAATPGRPAPAHPEQGAGLFNLEAFEQPKPEAPPVPAPEAPREAPAEVKPPPPGRALTSKEEKRIAALHGQAEVLRAIGKADEAARLEEQAAAIAGKPADTAAKRSNRMRINNAERSRAEALEAGDHARAGEASADATLLREQLDPQASPTRRIDPDEVVASLHQNRHLTAHMSAEEADVMHRMVREAAAELPYDPRAHQGREAGMLAAAAVDDRLVDEVARHGVKQWETVPWPVRLKMQQRVDELADVIAQKYEALNHSPGGIQTTEDLVRHRDVQDEIHRLEADVKAYLSVLIPARSQDGRNLAFNAFMARRSWAPDYWIARARKLAGSTTPPEPGTPQADVEARILQNLSEGRRAQNALDGLLQQLADRGVTDHGIDPNTPAVPIPTTAEDGGVMSRLWKVMRAFITQQDGSFSPAKLFAFLRGHVESNGAPVVPVRFADPDLQALFAKAFTQAQAVRNARAALAGTLTAMQKTGAGEALASAWKAGLLTGAKTSARNIGGNLLGGVAEEASRLAAQVPDKLIGLATKQHGVSAPTFRKLGLSLHEAGTRGVREAGQTMLYGATLDDLAKMDIPNEVNTGWAKAPAGVPLVGGKSLFDGYVNTVFRFYAAQDRVFKAYALKRSILDQADLHARELAKLHGITGRDPKTGRKRVDLLRKHLESNPDQAMMEQAIADAEFATYQNDTAASRGISGLRSEMKRVPAGAAAEWLSHFVLPFAKTPSAVAMRVLDYVPLIGQVTEAGRLVQERHISKTLWQALTPKEQGRIAMSLGRGAVGEGLIALGESLYNQGLLTPSYDPSTSTTDQAAGRTPGALKLFGTWVPIGGYSPACNLLTLGATKARMGAGGLASVAAPLAIKTVGEQPMVQGMAQAVDLARPSSAEDLGFKWHAFLGGTLGSVVPTWSADLAAAHDDGSDRQVDTSSVLDAARDTAMRRIPFLREKLAPKLDALGRTVTVPHGLNAFNPLAGKPAREDQDRVVQEMVSLGIPLPKPMPYMNVEDANTGEKVRVKLTPELQNAFRQVSGPILHQQLHDLVVSPGYRAIKSAADREDEIRKEMHDALATGREEFADKYEEQLAELTGAAGDTAARKKLRLRTPTEDGPFPEEDAGSAPKLKLDLRKAKDDEGVDGGHPTLNLLRAAPKSAIKGALTKF